MAFYKKTLEKFQIIREQYKIEGSMTLRRIYYVLLGKGLVKPSGKKDSPYINLSKLLLKAREKGELDWKIIVDRTREIIQRPTFPDYDEAFKWICKHYRRDSMLLQKKYCEVWIEKDAISGNVSNETWFIDVPLIVGRGWGSGTYHHDAYERIAEISKEEKKLLVKVLYISDFDPEGFHIPEVLKTKLKLYGLEDPKVERIALTLEQIKKFGLKKNVGFTISKKQREKEYVKDFIKKYGVVQYEIDALPVAELNKILKKELKKLIDFDIPEISDKESEEEVETWVEEYSKEKVLALYEEVKKEIEEES
ncbi:hypothetical protein ES705_45437 [subsurface metagenome]